MEVWAAPGVPARASEGGYARVDTKGLANAATDRRANSLARLANIDGSSSAGDRWWYTLLATDVSSEPPAGEACAPVGTGKGRLMMAECAESSMLQLKPDGTLRPEAGSACVVAGGNGGGVLGLGTSGCTTFKAGADGTLRAAALDNRCLTNEGGALSLEPCHTPPTAQAWTTTDSRTGAYIEQASKHGIEIVADRAKESLEIRFVPAGAWTEANCTLSADGAACIGGHFADGIIGKTYPDCLWNASVAGASVVVDAISSGCKGCCRGTAWVKTGYIVGKAGVQERTGAGSCASACGGEGGNTKVKKSWPRSWANFSLL